MTAIRLHCNPDGQVAAAQVDDGPLRRLQRWRHSFGPGGSSVELTFLEGPGQPTERYENPTVERVGNVVTATIARDRLYERAEEAFAAGLPLDAALQAVRDGYSSAEFDRDRAAGAFE